MWINLVIKFLLTCDGGQGLVELTADIEAAADHHFLLPPKTPTQLRRDERRRNERSAAKAECERG